MSQVPFKTSSFFKKWWRKWHRWLLVFGLLVLLGRFSVLDWNIVPSGSMNPTIYEGDIVLTNKLAYDLRIPLTPFRVPLADPQRSDIVVFRSPESEETLVKRIVGLPGDTIEMVNHELYINGEPLNYKALPDKFSKYVPKGLRDHSFFFNEFLEAEDPHPIMITPGTPEKLGSLPVIVIPEDAYFMMGDNRSFSRDSRMYGFVNRKALLGRTKSVFLSFFDANILQPRRDRFFSGFE